MSPAPHRNQIDVHIGQRVRELRLDRQLQAEELAQALDVSAEQYELCEEGRSRFSAEQLFKLASKLNVKLADIYGVFEDKS